ncbi:hypothetical protein A2Y26_02870 [candidate division CPR2 bacterium GWD2_39_7]|nr:MAG: hypothetical protein A2Y27_03605 [candidate division CPR2 bacterium GWD1_39_7]OGB71877.1 MAG: hypothetical protein A2Y26_02870 [candidate division CPR2 bacterium GWD2_39_7]
MKYRFNKIKREHSIIDGGLRVLQEFAKAEDIVSVIPGPIKPSRSFTKTELTFQYKTETGEKYLLKGHGAVQEVFVVRKET